MEVEQVFMAQEVDIDYEFDAARCFNFTREETPAEARRAELWFESAKSYPPSRELLYLRRHVFLKFIFLELFLLEYFCAFD